MYQIKLLDHARANSYAIPAVNCTRYVIRHDFDGIFCYFCITVKGNPRTRGLH